MTAFDPDRPVSMTKPLPPAAGPTAALPPVPPVPVVRPATSYPPAGHPTAGYPPVAGPPVPYGSPPVAYPTVVMPQQSNAEIIVAWIVTGLTLLYMLPWAVAASRRSTNSVLIAIATFFLAWTGLGWLVLLVLSFLGPTVHSTRPIVAVTPYAAAPPAGAWGQHPADPPHVRRWWDGHGWTAHTTVV